jgi:hypothetical protein
MFATIGQDGWSLVAVIRQIAQAIHQTLANALALKVTRGIAGFVGLGDSGIVPAPTDPIARGPVLSQAAGGGDQFHLTVNLHASSIDSRGLEQAVMSVYPAITAATMQGVAQSRAAQRFFRGF